MKRDARQKCSLFQVEKLREIELANCFEDGTKVKRPSNIMSPFITTAQNSSKVLDCNP